MNTLYFILAGLALLGGAIWLLNRRTALMAEAKLREAIARQRAEAVGEKKEKDDEVDKLGPADVDARFQRWMRGDDSGG